MKYITSGVCAKEINFEIVDGRVHNVQYIGGCVGNLKAVSILVEGMKIEEVVEKFSGNQCKKDTSCTDQLAQALQEYIK